MDSSAASKHPDGQQLARSPFFKKLFGKAESYAKQPLRIKRLLNDSYQKAAQKRGLGQLAAATWAAFQVLFRLIGAAASGRYHGIPTPTLIGGIAVLLYFISPIDAIPDFIPAIGLLDDAALLAWFMTSIKDEMDRFAEWERASGDKTTVE
jgi:uncharacterized membrane protein YkvA (DUF1232 family)